VQVFRPLVGNDYILGAVGVLQFEVTTARLKNEYGVDAIFEPIDFSIARWVDSDDVKELEDFEKRNASNLARDAEGRLTFLTTSDWQLTRCMENWPQISFYKTREAG
jgi:peptide chain release factor 3